jgi:hypothetical protein
MTPSASNSVECSERRACSLIWFFNVSFDAAVRIRTADSFRCSGVTTQRYRSTWFYHHSLGAPLPQRSTCPFCAISPGPLLLYTQIRKLSYTVQPYRWPSPSIRGVLLAPCFFYVLLCVVILIPRFVEQLYHVFPVAIRRHSYTC